MIKILKASAGSGKTFNLAKTYIRTLFESETDHPYRHVLAVTFTNKATAEMKGRILRELHTLAVNPSDSPYLKDFVPSLFPDERSLKQASERMLTDILHDYSAFSISTIDKFFQQTLKAFSREIGQFSSYQIELDRKSLVHESVDRILDSLTEASPDLMAWLNRSVMEQLEQGGKVNLEKRLYEMAEKLSSEERRTLAEELGVDDEKVFSKAGLDRLAKECSGVIDSFTVRVKKAADAVISAFNAAGVDLEDTNRKFLVKVLSYSDADSDEAIKKPTPAFLAKASDPDSWFAKSKAGCLDRLGPDAHRAMADFCDLWDADFKVYCTAGLLKSQTYGLGLASELRREFDALLKEKNVLGLEDSNTILKGIIDGSDAPFVYEKLGVRYEHFLLDEFQDTSMVQWQNFLPLLKESDDNGRDNLVVGDVKQSIYRWRGSEWELLGSKIQQQFPRSSADSLKDNWRSTETVVKFNNSFFDYASKVLDSLSGIDGFNDISRIYADVSQTTRCKDSQKGSVEVTFCDAEDELDKVSDSIARAREAGAQWGDIAILVRNNKEGGEVASHLIACDIPVLSDDSLDVKSSSVVRRLVALLSCVDNPEDSLNSFLASEFAITLPEHWHSLVDLCEGLLRELRRIDEELFLGEVLYIQSFMDSLLDWTSQYGNNLMLFLKYWNEGKFRVSSPADTDAVRVMTIHKSKGLEFPYVIFPFAETVTLSGGSWHWCRPAAAGTSLEEASAGIYPVNMTKAVQDTLFSEDYLREKRFQLVDAINTFYVALTRAGKALHVIAATPSDKCMAACEKGQAYEFSDFSQILCCYLRGQGCCYGEQYDFSRMSRPAADTAAAMESTYPSMPVNPVITEVDENGETVPVGERGRLKYSADSTDFFGDGGRVGASASNRINGIVLHELLSKVNRPEDLREEIDLKVIDGQLSPEEAERDFAMLSRRLESAAKRGWLPEDAEVHSEHGIMATDGKVYRPDRVVCTRDRTMVIDYKFGSVERRHERQVSGYVALLREMGYPCVSGHVWYVPEDKVVDI